jgi:membrane-associated phospholipid phosphatase
MRSKQSHKMKAPVHPSRHSEIAYPLDPIQIDSDGQGWAYRIAHGLAYLVNPLILPPILFGLLLQFQGASAKDIGWAVAVGFICFALVPLAYVGWMHLRNEITSIEIPDKSSRTRPLLVSLGSYGAALPLMYGAELTVGPLLLAVVICYIVNTVLAALITLRWKISLHAISIAGFVSIMSFAAFLHPGTTPSIQSPQAFETLSWLFALVLLVMWARVRTGAHTPGQVVAGAVFGLVLPFLELMVLHRLDLL